MSTDKLIDKDDNIKKMINSEDLNDDSKRLLQGIDVNKFSDDNYDEKAEELDLNKSEINRQQSIIDKDIENDNKIIKYDIDETITNEFNDNIDNDVVVLSDASVSDVRRQVEGTLNKIKSEKISEHEEVQNRLDECTMLELLYLKKHNELKTSVELNTYLYNEFSNAMNIIYYILKNLVISDQEKEDVPKQKYNEDNPEPYVDKLDDIDEKKEYEIRRVINKLGPMLKSQQLMEKLVNDLKKMKGIDMPTINPTYKSSNNNYVEVARDKEPIYASINEIEDNVSDSGKQPQPQPQNFTTA